MGNAMARDDLPANDLRVGVASAGAMGDILKQKRLCGTEVGVAPFGA
jgi:hypothetical protein